MKKKVIVIGAGINGLVAAHYLQKAGCMVTLLERKEKVGGACTFEHFEFAGVRYALPTGASVFGMMQDFIFKDTGLSEVLKITQPKHPALVYFKDDLEPTKVYDKAIEFQKEAKEKWQEEGDLAGYSRDLERVRQFLIRSFQEALVPSWSDAVKVLGKETAKRWITGSALDLFNHYFTSDKMKILKSMAVTESGPVPLDSPSSAFNIVALSSGNIFGGDWGFVLGGLWNLPLKLSEINQKLGVELLTSVHITHIDTKNAKVTVQLPFKKQREFQADAIFFATDPKTAAHLTQDPQLSTLMENKKFLGSSGKIVLVFKEPVVWKGDTGQEDFDCAFRFIYATGNLKEFSESNQKIRDGKTPYSPSCHQVYCEGAAMRKMGWNEKHDYLSVFFKDLGFSEKGEKLEYVKKEVEEDILSKIENRKAFIGSVLFTPKDLTENFFFPEGNIDHMELCEDQNFFQRTFSANPKEAFYQFGTHEKVFYCGSGSYPSGSVAGTSGYLCATQWLKNASVT